MNSTKTLDAVRMLAFILGISLSCSALIYNSINGSLCISSKFTENKTGVLTPRQCAFLCDNRVNCQAFTTHNGPCQLFVFDKCSKSVKDCSCTRTGQVFVKQQPGLAAGALCPSGYGDDLCGVKYKTYNGIVGWNLNRQKCESESGLVIMADVIGEAELSQAYSLQMRYSANTIMWLGGLQAAGSAEPSGGWYWFGCNITLDSSLWGPGEPDNYGGNEIVTAMGLSSSRLRDFAIFHPFSDIGNAVLCECVSPFA